MMRAKTKLSQTSSNHLPQSTIGWIFQNNTSEKFTEEILLETHSKKENDATLFTKN